MQKYNLSGKKILFVLPPCNFHDEQYLTPRAILENAGAHVSVASSSLAPTEGMSGALVTPDTSMEDVKAEDFDVVLLVGGVALNKFWHHAVVHNLVREAKHAGSGIRP